MPDTYTPPDVWTWDKESGGQFSNINRPIAGPTHDKELPVGKHPFQLYSLATPNGVKVTVLFEELLAAGRPYLLIGFGRWGSSDPWLGIPVDWGQICGAKVIVEATLPSMAVEPSQGSHFFQNLTSFMIGYFTVNSFKDEGFVDWKWLQEQKHVSEMNFTRHLHFEKPITIKMNGQQNKGIILKPGK